MTKDHQTTAERRIIEQMSQMGEETKWTIEECALDPKGATNQIEEMQAALDHQTERLRIAIERAEKAEAQRKADAEEIKPAEALADALTTYNRGGAGPLTGWIDVEEALAAFRQAQQACAEKGGE